MVRSMVLAFVALSLLISCGSEEKKNGMNLKSMEQIHQAEGVPVKTRKIQVSPFNVFLKYPATVRARSESNATAALNDVVRNIYFNIGDYVEKDQVVLTFSKDNPTYQQALSAFENAESAFKRSRHLLENKGISQQNFDNAKTQYEVARANLKAADDMVNVKAPISGSITHLAVQVTDNREPGNPLFTVSNLDFMEAKIWVSAQEIGEIRRGQKAEIEWLGNTIAGTVTRVNLIMDSEKKAFQVIAEFRNPKKILTSGITADVSIETYAKPDAIVVSRKELVRENDKFYAFVAKDGTAVRREVGIGRGEGFSLEVLSGLAPGDLLITEGAHHVNDGDKIQTEPDGPAKAAGK